MTPKIRAHRILKDMPRYISFDVFTEQELSGLSSLITDSIWESSVLLNTIGVYYTHDTSLMSRIWFLTEGIVYEMNHVFFSIQYSSIIKVDVEHKNKRIIKGILLITNDKKEYFIPIQSNENGTSDAFEILRYFDRVLGDITRIRK